jgi:hypothetical protein
MLTAYIQMLPVLRKLLILRHPLYLTMPQHLEHPRMFCLQRLNPQRFLGNWASHCHISATPIQIRNNILLPTLQSLGTIIYILKWHLRLPDSSQDRFLHLLKICCYMTLVRNKLPYHHFKDHILAPRAHLIFPTALRFPEIDTQVWISCPADLGSCPV